MLRGLTVPPTVTFPDTYGGKAGCPALISTSRYRQVEHTIDRTTSKNKLVILPHIVFIRYPKEDTQYDRA